MRRSHRVEPGRFQQLDSALLCPVERRRPKRSVIVVDTPAGQLDRPSVQQQSVFRRPRQSADTKRRHSLIHYFAVLEQLRDSPVEPRSVGRPKRRIGDGDFLARFGVGSPRDCQPRLRAPDRLVGLVHEGGLHG